MRIDAAFPSKYLKTSDLMGRRVLATIANVKEEEVEDGKRLPVMYFVGKDRGLVLNKTNASTIMAVLGVETDGWIGQKIELFEMQVSFQGRMTPGIRVSVPRALPQAHGAVAAPAVNGTAHMHNIAAPVSAQAMTAYVGQPHDDGWATQSADGFDADEIPF